MNYSSLCNPYKHMERKHFAGWCYYLIVSWCKLWRTGAPKHIKTYQAAASCCCCLFVSMRCAQICANTNWNCESGSAAGAHFSGCKPQLNIFKSKHLKSWSWRSPSLSLTYYRCSAASCSCHSFWFPFSSCSSPSCYLCSCSSLPSSWSRISISPLRVQVQRSWHS